MALLSQIKGKNNLPREGWAPRCRKRKKRTLTILPIRKTCEIGGGLREKKRNVIYLPTRKSGPRKELAVKKVIGTRGGRRIGNEVCEKATSKNAKTPSEFRLNWSGR